MPVIPDAPLLKVTLNLYADDATFLRSHFGTGYSVAIRHAVQEYCRALRSTPPITIADLTEELE